MCRSGLAGLPGRHRWRKIPSLPTAADLADLRFRRDGPDQLWVTDIAEHPNPRGSSRLSTSLYSSATGEMSNSICGH